MKYRITIPEPCHEDWDKMTPTEKGRFCDKCQKCVVDFTTHSTNQLFQVFEKEKNICGRFRPDQLERDLLAVPLKKSFSFHWALSGFIAFFGASQAVGQNEQSFPLGKIAPVEMKRLTPILSPTQDSSETNDTIRIHGTVADNLTGETIPFANIVCMELNTHCTSDLDGNYSFLVDRNELTDSTILHISFLGYQDIDVLIEAENQPQNIFLAEKNQSQEPRTEANQSAVFRNIDQIVARTGGVCLTYEPEPTFWQRIGNWFRWVF